MWSDEVSNLFIHGFGAFPLDSTRELKKIAPEFLPQLPKLVD